MELGGDAKQQLAWYMQSSIASGACDMTCFQIFHGKEDRWYWMQQLDKAHEKEYLHLFIDEGYA